MMTGAGICTEGEIKDTGGRGWGLAHRGHGEEGED